MPTSAGADDPSAGRLGDVGSDHESIAAAVMFDQGAPGRFGVIAITVELH